MVRILGGLVGLGFVLALILGIIDTGYNWIKSPPPPTAEHEFHAHPRKAGFSFEGVLGKYDNRQLQRGLQVYKEVCSACHSMHLVPFRALSDLGYSQAQVKAFAAEYTVQNGPNDDGEIFERPGIPSDFFPSPFPNEQANKVLVLFGLAGSSRLPLRPMAALPRLTCPCSPRRAA